MKDVDTFSRNQNLLIRKYLTTTCVMRGRDIRTRLFAYNHDVFHRCSNPRHVKYSSRVLISTFSSTPTLAVIHHSSLHFLQSPSLLHLPPNTNLPSNAFISPDQYTWTYFDSIILSYCLLFQSSPTYTIDHFAFETNTLHYRTASFLSSRFTLHYTTL